MPPRFSIWMVLAGVVTGVLAGYLAGSGLLGKNRLGGRRGREIQEIRAEFSRELQADRRAEILRAFDAAVRRVSAK